MGGSEGEWDWGVEVDLCHEKCKGGAGRRGKEGEVSRGQGRVKVGVESGVGSDGKGPSSCWGLHYPCRMSQNVNVACLCRLFLPCHTLHYDHYV